MHTSTKRKHLEGSSGDVGDRLSGRKEKHRGLRFHRASDFASAFDQLGPVRIASPPTWPVRHRRKGGGRRTCNGG
eukprot:9134998-Pyramimonas_sp.AAC.1